MPLIDETFFLKRHGQSAGDFPEGLIDSHPDDAESELRDLVTDSKYETTLEISGKKEADRTDDEKRQLSAFQRAEAELLMYCILPKLNVKIGREGIVQSNHSQNFGEGTFTIATPQEIEKIQKFYTNRAVKCIKKYLPAAGFVTAVFQGESGET